MVGLSFKRPFYKIPHTQTLTLVSRKQKEENWRRRRAERAVISSLKGKLKEEADCHLTSIATTERAAAAMLALDLIIMIVET